MSLRSQSDPLTGVVTGTLSVLLLLLALLVREPSVRNGLHTGPTVSPDTLASAAPAADSLDSSEELLVVDTIAVPAPTTAAAGKEKPKLRVPRKSSGIFAAQVRVTLRWSEGKKRVRVAGKLPGGLRAKAQVRMVFDLVVTPTGHIRKTTVKEAGTDPAQRRLAQVTLRTWRFAPLARNIPRRDQHCLVTWLVQPAR